MRKGFLVGFGEVDITPSVPVLLSGYYYERRSTGVHDPLHARSMAISDGDGRVVLCVADLICITEEVLHETRRIVRLTCGLRPEELVICAIHTHTGPDLGHERQYAAALPGKLAESVRLALADLSPAELRAAHGRAPGLQFIRRYRMKDGSVRTNPGIGNPDILEPIGQVDPEVQALLALSEDGRPRGGLVHFALHCDTVGGCRISADWTHYLRRDVQRALGRKLCLLTPIGPCGDVNHWNVFRRVSLRGFAETERIGTRIARAALAALRKARPVRPRGVCGIGKTIRLRTRMPSPAEVKEARRIFARGGEEGVDFTLDRVEAARKLRAAALGPEVPFEVTVLAFGDVATVGIPAEFFTALGRSIKRSSPFAHTLVCTLANGDIGYVGERQNYVEGGYEMTSSVLAPGSGERIVAAAGQCLRQAARRIR